GKTCRPGLSTERFLMKTYWEGLFGLAAVKGTLVGGTRNRFRRRAADARRGARADVAPQAPADGRAFARIGAPRGGGNLPHHRRAAPRWHQHPSRGAERAHGAQGRAALLPHRAGPRDVQRRPRVARRGRADPPRLSRFGQGLIDFLQNTLDGLALGSSYALLALGFTLIFGVLRRANLAYGPAILFGCYCATWAYLETGIGLLFLALIAVA